MARRPTLMAIDCMAALPDRLFVADRRFPVVGELSRGGALLRFYTWETDPRRRGAGGVNEMVVAGGHLVVTSSVAHGLVSIDLSDGSVVVTRLDDLPRRLLSDEAVLWTVSDGRADDNEDDEDDEDDEDFDYSQLPHHPIVREAALAPTGPEAGRGFAFASVRGGGRGPEVDADDNDGLVRRPSAVWRLGQPTDAAFDLGGDVQSVTAVGGQLVAVVRRPDDPLVVQEFRAALGDGQVFSSWSRRKPCSVVVRDQSGEIHRIGSTHHDRVTVCADEDRVWLLDTRAPMSDAGRSSTVQQVDVTAHRVLPPTGHDGRVIAVVDGCVVSLGHGPEGLRVLLDRPGRPSDERIVPDGDIDWSRVEPRSAIWLRQSNKMDLIRIDTADGTVSHVAVRVDVTEALPAPAPPWVRPAEFESEQLDALRTLLLAVERGSDSPHPSSVGVTFTSVELDGTFPDTAVVGQFTSDQRPGVLFGYAWPLYDALGGCEPASDWSVRSFIDHVSRDPGLPSASDCQPNADGLVHL